MDSVDAQERSRIMSKIKGQGNKSTELRLIKIFKDHCIKGWKRNYPLVGKPDFVFLRFHLAIFVDGCFWHGCKTHCRIPKTNSDYWVSKIERNKKRDKHIRKELRKKGWTVIGIWEHELKKKNFQRKIKKIQRIIDEN